MKGMKSLEVLFYLSNVFPTECKDFFNEKQFENYAKYRMDSFQVPFFATPILEIESRMKSNDLLEDDQKR